MCNNVLTRCFLSVGAISDASTSKYRRRVWVIGATAVIGFGTRAVLVLEL